MSGERDEDADVAEKERWLGDGVGLGGVPLWLGVEVEVCVHDIVSDCVGTGVTEGVIDVVLEGCLLPVRVTLEEPDAEGEYEKGSLPEPVVDAVREQV